MFEHIVAAGLIATQAAAEVSPRDLGPTAFSFITYVWVFAISILGGIVNFIRKVRDGETRAFRFTEFIGEIVTSAFAGVITFYLCKATNIGELLTAVFVGVAGHMGSRAIFKLEKIVERWFDARVTVTGSIAAPDERQQKPLGEPRQ
jgi:hypothetical protein